MKRKLNKHRCTYCYWRIYRKAETLYYADDDTEQLKEVNYCSHPRKDTRFNEHCKWFHIADGSIPVKLHPAIAKRENRAAMLGDK